ncbi:MAG: DUF881 domain-containing protein [Anaerolineae bacterium]|nr:DUF881 domain-containing protein [Anaerolineae bacterium]
MSADRGKQAAMLGAALVLGLLVSLQWPTGSARRTASLDPVSQTIRELEVEQAELKRQVSRLRATLTERQQEAVERTDRLADLRSELLLQQAQAGLIEVEGPGVRVTLDDGAGSSAGRTDDLLVHDYDLRDVINVLWLGGAEAVSVNGERIVHSTSVYCVGSTVLVNDTRMAPPYEVSAIGEPMRLLEHLRNPGYLVDLRSRAARLAIALDLMRVEWMTIPAYQGSVQPRFAQPGGRGVGR